VAIFIKGMKFRWCIFLRIIDYGGCYRYDWRYRCGGCHHRRDKACLVYTPTLRVTRVVPIFIDGVTFHRCIPWWDRANVLFWGLSGFGIIGLLFGIRERLLWLL